MPIIPFRAELLFVAFRKEYFEQCITVNKSIYDLVMYDSEIEGKFAEALDKRADVKLFVKLPSWFKVETPVGEYNPVKSGRIQNHFQ